MTCKTSATESKTGLALWGCDKVLGFALWVDYTGQYPNFCPGCGADVRRDLSPKVPIGRRST